ncbi:hypothetical protein GCK72_011032 [Caenorhabditis remanei]|uniref:Uncharacterized protein n=1 Tax=Caenorhabditis remanei TaxID=31234 RepID=A0A6A5H6T5_CAERE|nr:hypothetical protein GCK72_011032 [Caenorhabditis remanei]KAF1762769.1 hypothetical protein GCK72_011032 [Caenorhabditis remanei]
MRGFSLCRFFLLLLLRILRLFYTSTCLSHAMVRYWRHSAYQVSPEFSYIFYTMFQYIQFYRIKKENLVSLNKGDSLGDILVEFWNGGIDKLLLECRNFSNSENLLNSIWSQFDWGREIFDSLNSIRSDVCALNILLSLDSTNEGIRETSSSQSHRKSGRSGSSLCVDDFSSSVLDSWCQFGDLFLREFGGWGDLGEEWDDGDSCMSSDDWDDGLGGVVSLETKKYAIGTVELTGLVMMAMRAFGEALAMTAAKSRTIPAFVLNKSSRVIPGLRGTPAGMTMTSAFSTAAYNSFGPV